MENTDDSDATAEGAAGAEVERLVAMHLPALRAYVRAHMGAGLRARESTSDLVQSVCRELLTHRERYRHPGDEAFRAWLFTTARRKISNRARDLGRQKRDAGRELDGGFDEQGLEALGEVYARFTRPSGAVLRREELEQLETALDRLNPDQREVLTLAHMAGLSRAEIGRQTGRTEEAVRALLYRATARLAILIGPGQ